jgi:predicted phage gp36 major capsid-like protein
MFKLKELKEQRAALIHQQRDLFERAKKEDRTLTTDENEQFERMEADAAELRRSIENTEKMVQALGEQPGQERQKDEEKPLSREDVFRKYLSRGITASDWRGTVYFAAWH